MSQREIRERERASAEKSYQDSARRRDELYGIYDQELRDKEAAYERFDEEEADRDRELTGTTSRALAGKMSEEGFGGGGIMSAAQTGMELGEKRARRRSEAAKEKRERLSDLRQKRKENIQAKEEGGSRERDYSSAYADGVKELNQHISDTRGAWYVGGDNEKEAERRMRASIAVIRERNPAAADALEASYLTEGGEGWKSNHQDG